ncbi:MAG: type VI secretion system baseplate subunit TssG [Polyangiaceae bacterium]|nr:type VI secretion system baseplate subunit TssG [Myxococcales bacterium]MCB9589704.1 type VI secretion system baseplate subunit TssG [Polyangiaceae bacterium]
MAGAQRQPDDSLIERLVQEAPGFSFFQAVQLLHRVSPNLKAVGDVGPPEKEVLRFRVNPELKFAAGDIEDITAPKEGVQHRQFELTANFMGLVGASSPLCFKYTEEVIAAELDDNFTLRGFYDIFHHRLLSLFFRAWKKYRLSAGFRTDGSDPFTRRALAFVGVDPGAPLGSDALPPRLLLTLAPILAQRTRSSRTLEIALRRLLPGVTVGVEPFVERQVRIPFDQRVKLGVKNTSLDSDFTIGERVLDRAGRFRVKVGPVDYEDFEALMPGGENYPLLRQVVHQFTRGVLEPELEVTLATDQSPRFQLGNSRGALLGTTTQLVTKREKPMKMRVVLAENTKNVVPQLVADDE